MIPGDDCAAHGDVRVLTVDDFAPFLRMARDLIAASPGFVSAGEVGSGTEACGAIDADEPELVLMDVHMPGMDGVEVTGWIRRCHQTVVVILITADELSTLPVATFRCGAAAVIRKQDLRPSVLKQIWLTHGTG